jgi:hypothetical protein
MVPLPFRFSLSQMGEGYAAIQMGGGQLVVGDVSSLITQSASSVNTQNMALKYVMASEPYKYT